MKKQKPGKKYTIRKKAGKRNWKAKAFSEWLKLQKAYRAWKLKPSFKVLCQIIEFLVKTISSILIKKLFEAFFK